MTITALIACRVCGVMDGLDTHHIVHKRLGGDDVRNNLIVLCREHHQAAHDRKLDLLPYLNLEQQGHASSLIGIERAHRLLAPSCYRGKVAA